MKKALVVLVTSALAAACGSSPSPSASSSSVSSVSTNFNANNCEFFVDGFAKTYQYNQGWSRHSLHAELVIRDANIEDVGMWVRYLDKESGETFTREIVGQMGVTPLSPTNERWIIEFPFSGTDMPQPYNITPSRFDFDVLDFAFFAERKSEGDGSTVRLWLSGGGRNFNLTDTMAEPTFSTSLGRGSITWANQNGAIFSQKKACYR